MLGDLGSVWEMKEYDERLEKPAFFREN